MGQTLIEKIFSSHSGKSKVNPSEIINIQIDARVARDFGGANVVKNLINHDLSINDKNKTFFTFDCNPTGSDQNYAVNQHICRMYARKLGIRVYDINKGIGTHILIDEGLAYPGSTAVSTDSHANILGAIGAFGQGMGDMDITAAFNKGKIWFKVPESIKIVINGKFGKNISAKDIALNLLHRFGSSALLGYSVEMEGRAVEDLTLDQRITISSMATELGAIILFFTPNAKVIRYCEARARTRFETIKADINAEYARVIELEASEFTHMVSRPGKPHNTAKVSELGRIWIDSAFIGSCTNGRIEDIRAAARILKGKKVAEGVVLKVVPSTDLVWQRCLDEGLIEVLKEAGALFSNAGCAGCAAGQVGQNGPGEITISTGNRNFPGKQGKGEVYLASPEVVAASAVAGFITGPEMKYENLERPGDLNKLPFETEPKKEKRGSTGNEKILKGKARLVPMDDIDTDMIFHNRHLTLTNPEEMAQHTFGNLPGFEKFPQRAEKGDMVFTGYNFGSGSSRQQAVDCFKSLGISAIIAGSFGAIYERNAINAAFPALRWDPSLQEKISEGDQIELNLETGELNNHTTGEKLSLHPLSEVQLDIYQNGGLF